MESPTYKSPLQPCANAAFALEGFCSAPIHWLTTAMVLLLVRGVFEVLSEQPT